MPWRLILAIVVFAVLLVFITLNLDNKCDVSFGFASLPEVPVFLTVLVPFAAGLFCAFPLAISMRRPRADRPVREKDPKEPAPEIDAAAAREKFRARLKSGNKDE